MEDIKQKDWQTKTKLHKKEIRQQQRPMEDTKWYK